MWVSKRKLLYLQQLATYFRNIICLKYMQICTYINTTQYVIGVGACTCKFVYFLLFKSVRIQAFDIHFVAKLLTYICGRWDTSWKCKEKVKCQDISMKGFELTSTVIFTRMPVWSQRRLMLAWRHFAHLVMILLTFMCRTFLFSKYVTSWRHCAFLWPLSYNLCLIYKSNQISLFSSYFVYFALPL